VETHSHFLNSIKVTWRVQLRCDAVSMTSSPSNSLRFSLLSVIFRTTLNKTTSRRFQLHLRKAPFCSGISFHLLPSFCNAIGQPHEANLQVPCSVKTPQYPVRKCVHKGKPRATNRSRVKPITVQCKAGNCEIQTDPNPVV